MRAFDSLFQMLIDALAILAGAVIAGITVAITLNAGMRVFWGSSIYGLVDGIEIALMAATFLAAPYVLNRNGHVAVDIFLTGLSKRARRNVDIVTSLFGTLLSIGLGWSSLMALMIAFERGSMIRGVLILPEWIPLIAPSLAGLLLAIEFLRRSARGRVAERQQTGL